MCNKRRCHVCNRYYNKRDLHYHNHYDKYWKTWWCKDCLSNHVNRGSNRRYKLL